MEEIKMITVEFTQDEVQSLIQSLESERDHYLKEYGSCSLSIVRELAQRAVNQNNQLIQKLETLIGEGVPL
jgi:hypothetical protein